MKTLLVTTDDIRHIVLDVGLDRLMDEVIDGLTQVCLSGAADRFEVPVRDGFHYDSPTEGLIEWMPALEAGARATVKLVGYHPSNPVERGLPTILSVAMTFDTNSGHLLGLIDGAFATAVRTGAASAVASRILACAGVRVLGLVGAGAQAVTQLHALSRVMDIRRVLVCDTDPAVAGSFAQRAAMLGLADTAIDVVPLEAVTRAAQVLCTQTSVPRGDGPVFVDAGLDPAIHINAVGSDFPGKTEVPLSVLERSLVVPDMRAQAAREGECQQLDSGSIGPELAELVRRSEDFASARDRSTVFDSTGWALEDHVVVDLLMRHAVRLGRGTPVALESISADPTDPYGFLADRTGRRQMATVRAVAAD